MPVTNKNESVPKSINPSQKSDPLGGYDRKSNSKKPASSIPNDDIRSQIMAGTGDVVKPQVDLPPPIKDTFMQSQESIPTGGAIQKKADTAHNTIPSGNNMPDLESS